MVTLPWVLYAILYYCSSRFDVMVAPIKNVGDLSYIILPQSNVSRNSVTLLKTRSNTGEYILSSIVLKYKIQVDKPVLISLYDLRGRRIQQITSSTKILTNPFLIKRMLRQTAKGMYVYTITQNGKLILSRMIGNHGMWSIRNFVSDTVFPLEDFGRRQPPIYYKMLSYKNWCEKAESVYGRLRVMVWWVSGRLVWSRFAGVKLKGIK